MPSQNPYSPPPDDQARPGQVAIDNAASNQGAQGVMRDVTIHHHHSPAAPPTPSTLTARQRAELLDRLARRYQELLDHALAHQVRLQLGLHTRPDAVVPASRRGSPRVPRATSQPVPPGTPLLELFDGHQGQLLVLGVAGAGKTTLIVELAQALTHRARADGQARLPVVLNVAAWRNGQSLHDWLQPLLRDVLGTSKNFAAQLAESDDLLLLLDGLDEVATQHQAKCVEAISAYLGACDLAPPLVVGCRSQQYADLGVRLEIEGAVELEPLELPVIEQALASVPAAHGVLQALQADELLRELAKTPLMVDVLLLTYANQPVPQVTVRALEEQRAALWAMYIRRVFQQHQLEQPEVVLRYLRWIAEYLRERNETDFLTDNLQPTALPSCSARRWYRSIKVSTIGIITSSILAVVLYLVGDLFAVPFAGGFVGLLIGVVFVIRYEQRSDWKDLSNKNWIIRRQEQMVWSWSHFWSSVSRQIRENILTMVMVFFMSAVGYGLLYTPLFGLFIGLGSILIFGIVFGPILGLLLSINEGLQAKDLSDQVAPMQGIYASWKTGIKRIFLAIVTGVPGMIVGTKLLELLGLDLSRIERIGIASVIGLGLVFGFVGGIDAFLWHHILRLILSRAGLFPFRAVTFLDAMSERLLLERDGAFYRFRHLLLRDFIADLSDDDIARLAREVEGEGVQG